MEAGLIRTFFAKLLEALRFGSASPKAEISEPEERRRESFSVISEGIPIKGEIVFPSAKPARLFPGLIICHGIPGSGAERPPDDPGYEGLATEFSSLGLATVIFNFRGCGESGGSFDMMGWTRDLEVVLDHVRNTPHIDPSRILVLGFSGGGAASVYVAAQTTEMYGLAVVGTPAHFRIFDRDPVDIVDDFRQRGIIRSLDFPPDVTRWLKAFEEIEPRRWVAHFKGKHLLIVHGDQDELIPLEHARELYDAAPRGITELSIIPGGEHRLRTNRQCLDLLKSWFLGVLGWRRPAGPSQT
ncbi:MAG: alpha/beta fold hydrolase [Thermodesulfobacteriota bacterium]